MTGDPGINAGVLKNGEQAAGEAGLGKAVEKTLERRQSGAAGRGGQGGQATAALVQIKRKGAAFVKPGLVQDADLVGAEIVRGGVEVVHLRRQVNGRAI